MTTSVLTGSIQPAARLKMLQSGSMMHVSDEEFDKLISQAMDELPQKYIKGLTNVLVTYEDQPTPEQRQKQNLRSNQTLFGLYEGIPRTLRGAGYNLVLPDKITIFKLPITASVNTHAELQEQVKHTLWHEIAHYYGLSHKQIHELDGTK